MRDHQSFKMYSYSAYKLCTEADKMQYLYKYEESALRLALKASHYL